MASYDELDSTLIPKLKRAAIDAYMCSDPYPVIETFEITNDSYTWVQSAGEGLPSVYTVSRPNESGEGGGKCEVTAGLVTIDGPDFGKEFDRIRSDIDTALAPWTWLPDPADIHPLVEAMRQASRTISLGSVNTDGTVTGGGTLAGNINLCLSSAEQMAGTTLAAFKSKFLSQIGTAVGGQHAISLVLGGHLAAQEKLWEASRKGVLDLVVSTTSAFDGAAKGGGVTWGVVFQVVGWALSGAGIFATGGAKTAVDVAKLGLDILKGVVPGADKGIKLDQPEANFDSIWKTFTDGLTKLNEGIKAEETTIRDNCMANLRAVNADRASYDLTRPALLDVDDDSDLSADTVFYRKQAVLDMCTTYLPAVATECYAAQGKVEESNSYNGEAWYRASTIGLGSYGPLSEYFDLWIVFRDLLGDLGDETKACATTLDLAIADIGRADSAAMDALEKHHASARDLGTDRSANNPWNQIPEYAG